MFCRFQPHAPLSRMRSIFGARHAGGSRRRVRLFFSGNYAKPFIGGHVSNLRIPFTSLIGPGGSMHRGCLLLTDKRVDVVQPAPRERERRERGRSGIGGGRESSVCVEVLTKYVTELSKRGKGGPRLYGSGCEPPGSSHVPIRIRLVAK